ncbi:CDGSH iron-sulfur domain-containing protein [Streptomyces poriferorum]|uniref:CDGSH iron-sulfur domain-containing protein n=1 Tax=Streptomyces poriferorum TaxID=2798799 RepID=A0ABY9IJ65_9ACTN|nr:MULTISPECIES: CDGSH iron-sulfur domain-containing protein [Streptomyces]MDP5316332.1 CDGSH iron-sulfur domain-containing protein [Streptomyces sp. Alt4]WLQ52571.1 CDGSH iron-sulfur domain-containing protein [Streptomyces sp. Alt1]WLQ54656.1 CDGSH iron-sulfur domain-containing protein [Streptomyces sp. Alt2]
MTVVRDGPVLVEGPVEIVQEDGTTATSERFVVAVCTCRRSRAYPWCDTSHRRRTKSSGSAGREGGDRTPGNDPKGTHDGDHH